MKYFAVFIPGFEEVVTEIVRNRLDDVKIHKSLDGAILFETGCTYDRLNFFCFNNIFALIDIQEFKKNGKLKDGENNNSHYPELHMEKILTIDSKSGGTGYPVKLQNFPDYSVISDNNKKIKSFRLVFSVENKPVSVNENLKRGIENFITRNSGMRADRSGPDTEFWFLYRREGFSVFMKRLTNHRIGEKSLHKGELSPQLAWFLCHAAGLKHGEIAFDPFCGYGAIPLAACKHFPIERIYASDNDPGCIKYAQSKNKFGSRCEIQQMDFRAIKDSIPEKADVIITDPPWGAYDAGLPIQKLYDDMLVVFSGLLKSGGRAVVLSAASMEFESAVKKVPSFTISKIIPILVSGMKAKVYIVLNG